MAEVGGAIDVGNASLLQLYTDNRTSLTRFAIHLTRSHSDAEDIVQDAFSGFRRFPRLLPPPKLNSVIYSRLFVTCRSITTVNNHG